MSCWCSGGFSTKAVCKVCNESLFVSFKLYQIVLPHRETNPEALSSSWIWPESLSHSPAEGWLTELQWTNTHIFCDCFYFLFFLCSSVSTQLFTDSDSSKITGLAGDPACRCQSTHGTVCSLSSARVMHQTTTTAGKVKPVTPAWRYGRHRLPASAQPQV